MKKTNQCVVYEIDELKSAIPIAVSKGFGILCRDEVYKLDRACTIKRSTLEYLLGRKVNAKFNEFYADRELFDSLTEIVGVKPYLTAHKGGQYETPKS